MCITCVLRYLIISQGQEPCQQNKAKYFLAQFLPDPHAPLSGKNEHYARLSTINQATPPRLPLSDFKNIPSLYQTNPEKHTFGVLYIILDASVGAYARDVGT